MSNIYIGGISFENGFSLGFQQTSLETSIINLESLSPTVINSSNVIHTADESLIDINSNDVSIVVTSNAQISVDETDLLITTTNPTIIGSSNANTTSSNLIINTEDVSVTTSVSINVNVNNLNIAISAEDVTTETSVNVNTDSSNITISAEDVNTETSVNANTASSNLIINTEDVSVTTSVSINVNVNNLNININSEDVSVTTSVNVNTDSSNITIRTEDVTTETSVNVNTDSSDLIINLNSVTNTISSNVNVNTSNIILKTNDSLASISIDVNTNSSIIHIVSFNGSRYVSATKTNIEINSLLPLVNTGVSNNVNNNTLLINSLDVAVSAGQTVNVNFSIIELLPFTATLKSSVKIDANISSLLIKPVFIDGAGNKIPDWKDSVSIDNPFWDKDSECKEKESLLYDNLITDMFNKAGVPGEFYEVDYSLNNEKVFGEDNDRLITRKYNFQYFTEQLPQDDKLWSKWGIEGMDNFHIYVSKQHFKQASQLNMNGNIVSRPTTPKPGDILLSTHNNVFYEIIEVKDKVEMFLQRSHSWDITIQPNVNKKYNVSLNLMGDPINDHVNQEDQLKQNDLIDNKKTETLYDDINNNNDPYGLF